MATAPPHVTSVVYTRNVNMALFFYEDDRVHISERERERETETETERQRQRDRETERQRDRDRD